MTDQYAVEPDEVIGEIAKLIRAGRSIHLTGESSQDQFRYREAVEAYDQALGATVKYLEDVKSGAIQYDQDRERELSQLWSLASTRISEFDPTLANSCFIKGQGWLDPKVWDDPRYKEFKISIDDMRGALMDFHKDQFARKSIPRWFHFAGVGFAIATFISLIVLLFGPDLSPQKKMIFNVWMAFCVAASSAFLGGTAAASGTLPLPLVKDAPIKFSALGGIAVFIIVFLLMTAAN